MGGGRCRLFIKNYGRWSRKTFLCDPCQAVSLGMRKGIARLACRCLSDPILDIAGQNFFEELKAKVGN